MPGEWVFDEATGEYYYLDEEALAARQEEERVQQAHQEELATGQPPAPTAPAPTQGGAQENPAETGTGGAGPYDGQTFGQAWLASGKRTVADLKAFADAWNAAYPNDRVTLGGSKGEKVTYRGRTYDSVISAGMGGTGASWNDITDGGGQTFSSDGLDPSYIEPWTREFVGSEGTILPTWEAPGEFQYDPYAGAGDFAYDEFGGFDPFTMPTGQDVMADPSYGFRMGEGQRALENSAAARGVLNSGGTLRDLINYGQQFASQEYGNVFDRNYQAWNQGNQNKLAAYQTNRGNALDTFNLNEGNRRSAYELNRNNAAQDFATNYGVKRDAFDLANQRATDLYGREWQDYLNDQEVYYRNQENAYGRLSDLARLGGA